MIVFPIQPCLRIPGWLPLDTGGYQDSEDGLKDVRFIHGLPINWPRRNRASFYGKKTPTSKGSL